MSASSLEHIQRFLDAPSPNLALIRALQTEMQGWSSPADIGFLENEGLGTSIATTLRNIATGKFSGIRSDFLPLHREAPKTLEILINKSFELGTPALQKDIMQALGLEQIGILIGTGSPTLQLLKSVGREINGIPKAMTPILQGASLGVTTVGKLALAADTNHAESRGQALDALGILAKTFGLANEELLQTVDNIVSRYPEGKPRGERALRKIRENLGIYNG